MNTKELKKMSRCDLLEILVEQSEKIEALEAQLASARETLEDRTIAITECGSIAEAALKLNAVFQSADSAANQYLENIEKLSGAQEIICAQREAESQRKASDIIAEAERKCETMISEAKLQAQAYWEEVNKKANILLTSQKELQHLINNKVRYDDSRHT